jgi:hypothetical protein
MGKFLEGRSRGRNLPGGTEEDNENFNHVTPGTGQDSNRAPVEYESREFSVDQSVRFFICRVEVIVRNGRTFTRK